jgi:shikimate kinase
MSETQDHSIVLMGLKHCGKSTQGRLLAKEMELDFFDTDEVIEQTVGQPVRTFYRTKGVASFMLEEEKACEKIVAENAGKRIIVATGGGICDNPPAITKLRALNTFVFLRLDLNFSIERVMKKVIMIEPKKFQNIPAYVEAEHPRTLKDVREIMVKKYAERLMHYESIADIIVDIKNAPIEENFKLLYEAIR